MKPSIPPASSPASLSPSHLKSILPSHHLRLGRGHHHLFAGLLQDLLNWSPCHLPACLSAHSLQGHHCDCWKVSIYALQVPASSCFMFPFAWGKSKFLSWPLWPLLNNQAHLLPSYLPSMLWPYWTSVTSSEELVMIWPWAHLTPFAPNTRSCLIQPLI